MFSPQVELRRVRIGGPLAENINRHRPAFADSGGSFVSAFAGSTQKFEDRAAVRSGADPMQRRLHQSNSSMGRPSLAVSDSFGGDISTGHDAVNETRSRIRR